MTALAYRDLQAEIIEARLQAQEMGRLHRRWLNVSDQMLWICEEALEAGRTVLAGAERARLLVLTGHLPGKALRQTVESGGPLEVLDAVYLLQEEFGLCGEGDGEEAAPQPPLRGRERILALLRDAPAGIAWSELAGANGQPERVQRLAGLLGALVSEGLIRVERSRGGRRYFLAREVSGG